MIGWLLKTGRVLAGAAICEIAGAAMTLGIKIIGDVPVDEDLELPDDILGGSDIEGVTTTAETAIYLVPDTEDGRTTSSLPRAPADDPLEGSLAWRRLRGV